MEIISCMLMLQIRAFLPPELYGHKTIRVGGHGYPRNPPSYTPGVGKGFREVEKVGGRERSGCRTAWT